MAMICIGKNVKKKEFQLKGFKLSEAYMSISYKVIEC